MTKRSRARAALGLTLLSTLEREDPVRARLVRERLLESTREDFDTVATLRWVSMKSHMDLSDGIREALGMTHNAEFWRRAFFDVLNRPLFSGFIHTFQGLLGSKPEILLRLAPAVFTRLFENIGTFEIRMVEGQCHFAVASFRDFPADEYTMMCFVEGVTGAFLSSGFVVGTELEVTRLHVDPEGHFDLSIGKAPDT